MHFSQTHKIRRTLLSDGSARKDGCLVLPRYGALAQAARASLLCLGATSRARCVSLARASPVPLQCVSLQFIVDINGSDYKCKFSARDGVGRFFSVRFLFKVLNCSVFNSECLCFVCLREVFCFSSLMGFISFVYYLNNTCNNKRILFTFSL